MRHLAAAFIVAALFSPGQKVAQKAQANPDPQQHETNKKQEQRRPQTATPVARNDSAISVTSPTDENQPQHSERHVDSKFEFPISAQWFMVLLTAIYVGLTVFYVVNSCRMLRYIKSQADTIDRQTHIMESQFALTQPRLHVDGVRVCPFEEGQQPIFFVKIMNCGSAAAAEEVSIGMKVELADSTTQYRHNQSITIPANESRECSIVSRSTLDKTVLTGLDHGKVQLRVSGHFTWGGKTKRYCYKYYPWPFDRPRPREFPNFVACDFDTDMALGFETKAAMPPARATLETHLIKSEIDAPEPPEEPNKRN